MMTTLMCCRKIKQLSRESDIIFVEMEQDSEAQAFEDEKVKQDLDLFFKDRNLRWRVKNGKQTTIEQDIEVLNSMCGGMLKIK